MNTSQVTKHLLKRLNNLDLTQRGNVFKVQKIVKYYGITRLYIGQNEYVTGNTSFVHEMK